MKGLKPYATFDDLRRHQVEGRDFKVIQRQGQSSTLVMAIHGGGIEPGTDLIATAIAGIRHSLYCFVGTRAADNAALHIASERFEEPRALQAVGRARVVVSIHGCRDEAAWVVVGGKDLALKQRITAALQQAGFRVPNPPPSALAGIHPRNICNRGRCAAGVQLEISQGLRQHLTGAAQRAGSRQMLQRFTAAIEKELM